MAITYEASGNGNCAFNALALYIADATQMGEFDGPDQFAKERQGRILDLFKKAKLIDEKVQWDALKQYIITQTTKAQLGALQVALAEVLRPLSIALIGKPDSQIYRDYINRTTQALLAAYDDYKKHGIKKDVKNDDIFRRHDFIAKKFEALKDKSANTVASELREWWTNEGVKKFLEQMGTQGEESGDAELVPLAEHYKLTFKYARKDDTPVTLTQYSFGEIPQKALDEMQFANDFSFHDEKENISEKAALLRYLSNAGIIVGKPSDDKTDYQILVQNKDEVIRRLKQIKDKKDKICPDSVINDFIELWQKYVKPTDIKSVTLRNDYAAHWNYEADRESAWLVPLKIAASVKTPEPIPVKKLGDIKNFYYEFLSSKQVKELKVAEPDANGRIEITGKLNNQAFDLHVTQTSVTTKSTHPEALKLLVEATAKRIAEEGLPKSVSVDTSDAASMKTIIAECKNCGITISNLAEVQKKITELEAAKQVEKAKPVAPTTPSDDPMMKKLMEQMQQGKGLAPQA